MSCGPVRVCEIRLEEAGLGREWVGRGREGTESMFRVRPGRAGPGRDSETDGAGAAGPVDAVTWDAVGFCGIIVGSLIEVVRGYSWAT